MLRIVQAPAAAARIAAARGFLSAVGDSERVLLLGGRTGLLDLLRAHSAERGAFVGFQTHDLGSLALERARRMLLQRGLLPTTALATTALCARVVADRAQAGRLGRLHPVADRPGLPRALSESFADLRRADVDPQQLHALDPDLGALLDAFAEALRKGALADPAETLRVALAAPDDGRAHVLALDLPVQHRLEARLLLRVCGGAQRALLTCPDGDARTLRLLRQEATLEVTRAAPPPDTPQSLGRIQRMLFSESTEAGSLGDEVAVLSAPGEGRECVELSRRLLWEAERGTPFERMAVLCQAATAYRPHIAEALRRAGIPMYLAAGSTRPDPAGRALLALLACRAEGLSATRFSEYLSLGVVPNRDTDGAPPTATDETEWRAEAESAVRADAERGTAATDDEAPRSHVAQPRAWERALVDAAVIGGIERWRRRLSGLVETLSSTDPETPEAAREAQARRKRQVQDLMRYALPLVETLQALPDQARWGQWVTSLSALATRAVARPERVLQVLDELTPMAELGPVGLEEVRRVLSPRLSELYATPGNDRGGRVFVGTPDEARGMAFDVVCIPGLAERIFPQKVREDPMLLDGVRRALDAQLSTSDDLVEAQRLALRIAVGAARRKLVLSYPRIDPERSRPRVPSFYALELLRAAEGTLPDYGALMERAEAATATRVGWPAPRDGRDAIDAAEHDLSLLQRLLHAPDTETTGAARYLLNENPHLARALRFRARRWGLHKLTAADGLVSPEQGAADALATHRLDRRAYSASALQHYADCPYRFYLHAIMGLSPEPPPGAIEQLDAAQRGRLFHTTQFRVLNALRARDALPVTHDNLDAALQALDVSLDETATEFRELLAPAVDRVFDAGVAAVRGDLRQWLRRLAEDPTWVPVHFEFAFGLSASAHAERDAQSLPEPLSLDCGIQLRGAIDVVERSGGTLRATDHKTGTPHARADLRIGGGRILQPALYALALRAAFPGAEVAGGRLYYCTARGGYSEVTVPLDAETEAAARQVAETLDGALQQGLLPAMPDEGACDYCDYRVVCGPYEAQRTRRKDQTELVPLTRLRRAR